MRSIGLVSLCLVWLLLPLSASAAPGITQLHPIEIGSISKAVPNGAYEISVLKDGEWHKAGSLSFDRFFREQRLDLSRLIPPDKTVRIKIRQKGGGAAHIDAVLLGGQKPQRILGSDDGLALGKVSKKDFDVIDSFGKTIDVSFPAGVKDMDLVLIARIEGLKISKAPFQFPIANLYKPMNEHSQFYSYQLKGARTSSHSELLAPNSELIFKEYSRTGTGHPAGYTYGWVSNDRENLYVKIDFTPDNTMDGDKDYAKMYVKTERGVKEFKVSVPETRWGTPSFAYTDKVDYEHKVYDFTIPLKEIGGRQLKEQKKLSLAFAAYGTAGTGYYERSVAYDDKHNRYLVIYDQGATGPDVYGQLVNADGTLNGAAFIISNAGSDQYNPSTVFDSVNERFLVAWSDARDYLTNSSDIYGAFVDADGHLVTTASGTNFVIANTISYECDPSLTYDSINKRFLVSWLSTTNHPYMEVYGALVNTDGTLVSTASGTNFPITTDASQWYNSAAYDSVSQRFLVTWENQNTSNIYSGGNIYGALVNADGTLVTLGSGTTSFIISSDSGRDPSVAFDSTNERFLVSWQTGSTDIYGALVNPDGTLVSTASGTNFVISDAANSQISPSAVYESAANRFLVAWEDLRSGTSDIYGQEVNTDGSLYSTASASNFVITDAAIAQYRPSLAYNSLCANALAVYRNDDATMGMTLIGNACPPNNPPAAATLVYPADGKTGLGASVTFRWKEATDPDNDPVSYHIYACTDPTFSNCSSMLVASSGMGKLSLAGFGIYGGFMLFGLVFAGRKWGKKAVLLVVVIALLGSGGMLAACSSGGGGGVIVTPTGPKHTVTGLSSGTTYYWKVVAYDGKGGATESAVWSFSTK